MIGKDYPSQRTLRWHMQYLPESGQLIWRRSRGNMRNGSVAGGMRTDGGYWSITLKGKIYAAHILVWIYVHGSPPPGILRHINGLVDDNRIENLAPLKRLPTMEDIEAKCEVVGDCWHWTAGMSKNSPAIRVGRKVVGARRYIFTELLGKKVPAGRLVSTKCESMDCVAPDHIAAFTRAQLNERSAKRTMYGNEKIRRAKISDARRKLSPYSDDFIARAVAMEGSTRQVAKQLGCSQTAVAKWRRSKAAMNNPWAGLMAA